MFNDPIVSWLYHRVNISLPTPLMMAFGVLYYVFPVLAVALAAALIRRAIKPGAQKNVIPAALTSRKSSSRAGGCGGVDGRRCSNWGWLFSCWVA